MWAYGVLLIEIWTQAPPFPNMNAIDVANKVSRAQFQPCLSAESPQLFIEMVEWCCTYNPSDRATAQQILNYLESKT